MDVTSLMRKAATNYKNRVAVIHGQQRLTFGEAWDRSVRLANGLLALGLKPGDRIAVLEDNCIGSSDIFQGAAIANLVRVPLYARDSLDAHLHMAGQTNCRALIVSENYAQAARAVAEKLPELEHLIIRDAGYEDWLAAQSPQDPLIAIDELDLYAIRHTGGTTGKHKGDCLFTSQLGLDMPRMVLHFSECEPWRSLPACGTHFTPARAINICRSGWPAVATSCWIILRLTAPCRSSSRSALPSLCWYRRCCELSRAIQMRRNMTSRN